MNDNLEEEMLAHERGEMVEVLKRYGIRDRRVLAAMGKVRRHLFIPEVHCQHGVAYGDHPWGIGDGQTISQPYIVAYMTEKLRLKPGERVLEIGTGSGYQAAILAGVGVQVFSIEVIPGLAQHAREVLSSEGFSDRVTMMTGDGYQGWPEQAPFDAVIVTCAPEDVPQVLVDQVKEGGRMILPVGASGDQRLVILRKRAGKVKIENDLPVRFVPMVAGRGRRET
jgi:protein-L-isoaspartate(D-aspartate) O-methyltransferase